MTDSPDSEFIRQAMHMAAAGAFHDAAMLQWLVSAVASALADRVLDLACGPGIVAHAIASSVGQVVGIDATSEMLRLARGRFEVSNIKNGRFSVAAAERLPFPNGSFDQVIARLALHHFTEVAEVLVEAKRVLRQGGRLIVADVTSSENAEDSALHNSLEQLRDPTHVRMFPAVDLLTIISEAGFEILHEESWEQPREFGEWAAIIANPARTRPLEHVMRVLARLGQDAGIALREESSELHFTHTWLFLIARAS